MKLGVVTAAALALAACATGEGAPEQEEAAAGAWPFPVERGSALPPPAQAASHGAPQEGVSAGGVDFGRWRSADPAIYAAAFQVQMRQRFAGRDAASIQADLQANGFVCEAGPRLDCRIEVMERQCAFDWYVVFERNRTAPVTGFDVMCLGAR